MPAGLINRSARRSHELKSAKVHFGAVTKAFVTVLMDLIGKAGGTPNFSSWTPGHVQVGLFLTELVAFIILAAVVYFFVVKPYEAAKARFSAPVEEAAAPADVVLLTE